MKCAKGIWLRCGLLPYRLRGQQLALALLLRDKPRTAAQLAAALTEKGYPCDSQMLEKSLARLTKRGILSISDGDTGKKEAAAKERLERLKAKAEAQMEEIAPYLSDGFTDEEMYKALISKGRLDNRPCLKWRPVKDKL